MEIQMYIAVYYKNEAVFVCKTEHKEAAKKALDHWHKKSLEIDNVKIVELQFDPFAVGTYH